MVALKNIKLKKIALKKCAVDDRHMFKLKYTFLHLVF